MARLVHTNELVMVEVSAPLLRAGMKLIVGPFPKRYALQAMRDALQLVQEFNNAENSEVGDDHVR